MQPKGTILIIGGAEDRGRKDDEIRKENNQYEEFEILQQLLPKNGKRERIEAFR